MKKYLEITDRNNNFIQVYSDFKNDKISYSTYHKEGANLDKNILNFITALLCQLYGKMDTQEVNNSNLPNYYRKNPYLRGKKRVLEFKEKDIKTGVLFNHGYQFTNL